MNRSISCEYDEVWMDDVLMLLVVVDGQNDYVRTGCVTWLAD